MGFKPCCPSYNCGYKSWNGIECRECGASCIECNRRPTTELKKYCPFCNKICDNGKIQLYEKEYICVSAIKLADNKTYYCAYFKEGLT